MGYLWKNVFANFEGNWSCDMGFQHKKLKRQLEIQTTPARKLIAERK